MNNQKYQFGHIQTFPRSISKLSKSKTSWAVSDIVAEASRVPDASSHVKNPQPHIHVAGAAITEIEEMVTMQIKGVRMHNGRAIRKDMHSLLGAVYSWPESVDNYDKKRFSNWQKDVLEFHSLEFGKVDCAIVHLDESFPHLHVYTIAPDARALSPGWRAKRETITSLGITNPDKKANLRAGNKAYREAMKLFQDRYHRIVGQYHGLDRLGPMIRRLLLKDYRESKKNRDYEAELRYEERKLIQQSKIDTDIAKEKVLQSLKTAKEVEKITIAERRIASIEREQAEITLNEAKASAAKLAPWLYSVNVMVAIFWKILEQFRVEPNSVKVIRKKATKVIKAMRENVINLTDELKIERNNSYQITAENTNLKKNNQLLLERMIELKNNNEDLSIENIALRANKMDNHPNGRNAPNSF